MAVGRRPVETVSVAGNSSRESLGSVAGIGQLAETWVSTVVGVGKSAGVESPENSKGRLRSGPRFGPKIKRDLFLKGMQKHGRNYGILCFV